MFLTFIIVVLSVFGAIIGLPAFLYLAAGTILAKRYREELPDPSDVLRVMPEESKLPFKYKVLSFFQVIHIQQEGEEFTIRRKLFYIY